MNNRNKARNFKIFITLLAIILIVLIIVYLFPVMKDLFTKDGQEAFKIRINNSGIWGIFILFGLQVVQIFLVIIPGEPIEILAGMCYGAFWGTIFLMASSCIISILIFFLVRKFGRRLVYQFSDRKKIRKIVNSNLFKDPKKIEVLMFVLFLIPGTPKDLLVYVAGLLPIKPVRFILISTFARIPSIITSTLAGANFVVGNWKLGIILYITIIIIITVFIFIIDKFDKNKTTKQAINIIK